MKFMLLATTLLFSATIGAKEITKEEFLDLFVQNKETYEEVKVGMTAEYRMNTFILEAGEDDELKETECWHHQKEVVVSTDMMSKYLVYIKSTTIDDCSIAEKKGDVEEYLEWRWLETVDFDLRPSNSEMKSSRIDQNGDFSLVEGAFTETSDNIPVKFKVQRDHSKSQFFCIVDEEYDKFKSHLLRRGHTDPGTIKLDNLKVRDFEP